jgi:hypothetical protein
VPVSNPHGAKRRGWRDLSLQCRKTPVSDVPGHHGL